ncbi:unnamed protein product [Fusarium venenatum]|uniref:Uncharacterized protein n=1 Tax=Fusarium venenatum TaxID=56646 RepID=A0A2L2T942_9HYPO|nr:uncharacterized protein FVRRES_05213 [Fusarium venenatum]CEI60777.1 unnamed protein product [Fusarium venenatum]
MPIPSIVVISDYLPTPDISSWTGNLDLQKVPVSYGRRIQRARELCTAVSSQAES